MEQLPPQERIAAIEDAFRWPPLGRTATRSRREPAKTVSAGVPRAAGAFRASDYLFSAFQASSPIPVVKQRVCSNAPPFRW